MKNVLKTKASDVWLADHERLIFCVGKDQFVDSHLRPCPKEDSFVRYKNVPVSEEERNAKREKEHWNEINAYHNGLDSFSSTEVVEEIDDVFGTFGFKNMAGEVIIEPQYASVGEFSHGLCPVCINRTWYKTPEGRRYYEMHWGYIDVLGKTVIPFKFREAWPFNKYGVAVVSDDYLEGGYLIDTKGNVIEHSVYPYLSNYYDYNDRFLEFSPVGTQYGDDAENNTGLYDTKERRVMYPPTASAFSEDDEDTILVYENGKYGSGDFHQRYINSRGEDKYPWQVGKGYSIVEKPNGNGYSIVARAHFYELNGNSPSYIPVNGKKYGRIQRYGVIDGRGNEVIPLKYEKVTDLGHDIFACYCGEEVVVFEME